MKFIPLVLLALVLSACATPQEKIASGYAELSATEQAQASKKKADREQEQQETEAAMMTAQADQAEIDRMNAEANATLTAIESHSQEIAVMAQAYQQTQIVNQGSLAATQTWQPVQATQTVLPTVAAAAMMAAESKAEQQQVIANMMPFLALIVVLAAVILTGILVWYAGSRALADIQRRQMDVEVTDRLNGAVVTSYGVLKYRPDAELVDRAPLSIPNLNHVNTMPAAPYIGEKPEILDAPVGDPLKFEAIKLVSDLIVGWGYSAVKVEGYRELKERNFNWNSPRWQKAIGYLRGCNFIQKNGNTWEFITQAQDILYRLNSPTPETTRDEE